MKLNESYYQMFVVIRTNHFLSTIFRNVAPGKIASAFSLQIESSPVNLLQNLRIKDWMGVRMSSMVKGFGFVQRWFGLGL